MKRVYALAVLVVTAGMALAAFYDGVNQVGLDNAVKSDVVASTNGTVLDSQKLGGSAAATYASASDVTAVSGQVQNTIVDLTAVSNLTVGLDVGDVIGNSSDAGGGSVTNALVLGAAQFVPANGDTNTGMFFVLDASNRATNLIFRIYVDGGYSNINFQLP